MFALKTLASCSANAASTVTAALPSVAFNRRCVIAVFEIGQHRKHQKLHLRHYQTSPTSASSIVIEQRNVSTTANTRAEALTNSGRSAIDATNSVNATSAVNAAAKKWPPLAANMVYRQTSQQQHHHSTLATFEGSIDLHAAAGDNSLAVDRTAPKPLVLLFAWMLSKNAHIEKYRQFWTDRGYDILTLQTSPWDLLLPRVGGRRNAANVYNFLTHIRPRYDQVVVHAFSVGGYQFCEFMDRMADGCRQGQPEALRLYRSIKGLIVDSCVFADDCPPGLSRAITKNRVVQPLIERSIARFLTATRTVTLDQYYRVQAHLFANEMNIPGLLLFSRDDVVSNVRTNFQLADAWHKKRIPTTVKCWDRSTHVLHYKENPEEYEYEVDRFVGGLDQITKAPKRVPVPPTTGGTEGLKI